MSEKKHITFKVDVDLIKEFDKSIKYKSRSQALRDFMVKSVQQSKRQKV